MVLVGVDSHLSRYAFTPVTLEVLAHLSVSFALSPAAAALSRSSFGAKRGGPLKRSPLSFTIAGHLRPNTSANSANRSGAAPSLRAALTRLRSSAILCQRVRSNTAALGTNVVSPSLAVASAETYQVPMGSSAASRFVTFSV